MKKSLYFLLAALFFTLCSCGNKNSISRTEELPSTKINEDNTTTREDEPDINKTLELKINNTLVDVNWLDNDSVTALTNLAKDGLIITMSKYGGFEQVGSLGITLPSNDERITTSAGDIVLYSSNQIVIFYESNTWAYTKLGHINMSKNELAYLLCNEDATITLTLK